jgi:hypothetical protein
MSGFAGIILGRWWCLGTAIYTLLQFHGSRMDVSRCGQTGVDFGRQRQIMGGVTGFSLLVWRGICVSASPAVWKRSSPRLYAERI